MTVTFFSNYLTHHQIPFCEAMCRMEGVTFRFVATEPMEAERLQGGWEQDEAPYELRAYIDEVSAAEALRLARESDVMVIGSAPERYVTERMTHHPFPLTLRYSERLYKRGRWRVVSPRGALLRFKTYFRYLSKPLYMLCASAYTAGDLAMLGSYLGRCYRWGYFPATTRYPSIESILDKKEPASLLWVARLIDWKHPEIPVEIARRLQADGYDFTLTMVGNGPREDAVHQLVEEQGVSDRIRFLSRLTPDQVRLEMERHSLFLFTSDQNEGWGAVLNEAMNSGCAVIADRRIGSVPFLIRDGENGYVYPNGDVDTLYTRVRTLLDDPATARRMGRSAYTTITETWCAEEAAARLFTLCEHLLRKDKPVFDEGPCSPAPIL
ncbi:MAG: glycosyltransferase family 4 protein [Clostridia bacterium]|nr:glycosyltransferase family 4 protein [Clostridia bacterium]